MKTLNHNGICPACEYYKDDAERKEEIKYKYERRKIDTYHSITGTVTEKIVDEHILRTCPRCGYEWKEECAYHARTKVE